MKIIFLLHILFVFSFYEHNKIFLIKSKYKGDNSIKTPEKGIPHQQVSVWISHVLIQIIYCMVLMFVLV